MTVIAPTILAETPGDYKEHVQKVHEFAKRVHIDVCDGEFAETSTVPANQLYWAHDWTVDIHAMVARPSEHVQTLVSLQPNLIIFHSEVKEDLLPVIKYVQQYGCKAGLGLLQKTVPSSVASLIEAVDHVMIFSGSLGHIGGTASLMQLEKVRLIRAIKQGVEIGWDGGVNLDNAFTLSQGGVDVLNVGGYIAKAGDPANAYATLVNEINKHGVI